MGGGGLAKGELAGVRVLVVDDDEDIREMLVEFLDLCGLEMRAAASGNEAWALFRAWRPSVVVSDIAMPDGTGLDLVRRIRALPVEEGALTPAIAFSAAASPIDCYEAGFHYHLVKPIEPMVLLDAIRDFVRADRAGSARWSVTLEGTDDVRMRFEGHVAGADMRAAAAMAAELLARAEAALRVILDLRLLTGFDPSVGAAAQAAAWQLRHKIRFVVVVGGSWLAQLVARGTCLVLGVPLEIGGAGAARPVSGAAR